MTAPRPSESGAAAAKAHAQQRSAVAVDAKLGLQHIEDRTNGFVSLGLPKGTLSLNKTLAGQVSERNGIATVAVRATLRQETVFVASVGTAKNEDGGRRGRRGRRRTGCKVVPRQLAATIGHRESLGR